MSEPLKVIPKAATGIQGLDEILGGGLPRGRPTLVCGNAGCGKTMLAMEFLVRGATLFNEPGVFMAFEETEDELVQNVASLGFDLPELITNKQLLLDFVHVAREEIEGTGEYDLEGLFIRLGHAIDSIGAKRVVLDTVETLFTALPSPHILRAELRRLFRWLKEKGVTAVITGERGDGPLTRHGLEEYVSDCVILLDQRIVDQVSTRRLHVAKYRGSRHGTNEYPFLINEEGIVVMPITSMGLQYTSSTERVSSGIPDLDTMLGGGGYYHGSTVLVSGTAGTGKSSLAAHFAGASCQRGQRVLYFAFEESAPQIMRNMRSIGIDLQPWVVKGLLRFEATRPAMHGLETHLATMYKIINNFQPEAVIVDPINAFITIDNALEVKSMLMRLVDFLKEKDTTVIFTSLTSGGSPLEHTDTAISSLVDTWLLLRDLEGRGERNRCMYILKSRGMAHSNQMREYLITNQGVKLLDVCVGPGGVLIGSARLEQEAREQAARLERQQEMEQRRRNLDSKRQALEAQIVALRAAFAEEEAEVQQFIEQEAQREAHLLQDRAEQAKIRQADEK